MPSLISDDAVRRFVVRTAPRPACNRLFWTGATYENREITCLHWTGSRSGRGTGRFWVTREQCLAAHRVAYMIDHGSIPDGHEVDHLCTDNWCVESTHLEAVTATENHRRWWIYYDLTNPLCPSGHLLSENITSVHLRNGRQIRTCAQCNRDRVARWRADRLASPVTNPSLVDLSPVCRNGHERTSENTRFANTGVAICKLCRRDVVARYKARKPGVV